MPGQLIDQLSLYCSADHLDIKLTNKLILPALFMFCLSGELYQFYRYEVVFVLLLQPKLHTILPGLWFHGKVQFPVS